MDDTMFRMLFFAIMNFFIFGGTYLYGRKHHPKLAPWLSGGSFVVLTLLCYFSLTWLMASVVLSIVYLRILKKPDQTAAFKALYAEHNIYSTTQFSKAVLAILGEKKWRYAEGKIQGGGNIPFNYFFWQGHTSSMVSSGQYVRTTVYTHYLAFIFPPGSITDGFKQMALAAADKSHYSFKQRLRFFFVPDTETPNLVTTAADGSFIIQYVTTPDVELYTRRLDWIKQNINSMQQSVMA